MDQFLLFSLLLLLQLFSDSSDVEVIVDDAAETTLILVSEGKLLLVEVQFGENFGFLEQNLDLVLGAVVAFQLLDRDFHFSVC